MFWELVKKYSTTFDITIYYYNGDEEQLKRLRRYVRVLQFRDQKVECEKAFFNYNLEPFISHVTAKHTYEIIHADFELQKNIQPHIDPRIDTYIAVSYRVADAFFNRTGVRCEVCANPLTLEKITNPPLWICAAQRLTSEKGGHRIRALVERLDKEDIKYYFTIFSNQTENIKSPNVTFMKQRLDIRPFIFGCDVFVAVSDSEGRCYSVAEKLGYGTGKLLITPCPSFFEQGADFRNSIILQFDMSNLDEVIEELRKLYHSKKAKKTFEPIKPTDDWDKYLVPGKPDYQGCKNYLVRTTNRYHVENIFDTRLGCVPDAGIEYVETDEGRLYKLLNWHSGALVEVIKEFYGKP